LLNAKIDTLDIRFYSRIAASGKMKERALRGAVSFRNSVGLFVYIGTMKSDVAVLNQCAMHVEFGENRGDQSGTCEPVNRN
jgi:hypothetical protein